MRRREFIAGLGSAAAWPMAARAQQQRLPVIGYLNSESLDAQREFIAAFLRGLGDTGYIEGRNVSIEYRWAESRNDRLPALALELVRRQVAVIVASSSLAALAAKTATATIPIVFALGADPVALGLVSSFNRPGANVTGISGITNALAAKKLELLHELVPQASVVAVLVNPANPNAEGETKDAQAAAGKLGLRVLVLNASDQSGIDAAFVTLVQQRVSALLVTSDAFFGSAHDQIIALSARHRVPAISERRAFTASGGLMSYGGSLPDAFRLAGTYAGRVLKGEKPGDLPVQQATRIELVLNLKTAKALGLTVPNTLLVSADEVIE